MYYTVQLPTYSECNGSKADSGTPYNSLYGKALPKGGGGGYLFQALGIWKGSKICHFGLKVLKDAFCGYEKIEKTFWFCDLFKLQRQCIFSS